MALKVANTIWLAYGYHVKTPQSLEIILGIYLVAEEMFFDLWNK